jgi:hypothetical protein
MRLAQPGIVYDRAHTVALAIGRLSAVPDK